MSGILVVVQARAGSTRLPGKVLLPLGQSTVLEVMLARVQATRLGTRIVVATTEDPADDAIVAAANRAGAMVWRGHPTDLLDRHYRAAQALGAEHVAKIPSDCPLIDPRVIDQVLGWYLDHMDRLDYASNLHPATHPDGNDVEVMRVSALADAWREATEPFEREHTTPFLWNRPERFRLGNVTWTPGRDGSRSHRLVLDYPEDYEVLQHVYRAIGEARPHSSVERLVEWLDAHPDVAHLNAKHRGSHWYAPLRHKLPGLAGPTSNKVMR